MMITIRSQLYIPPRDPVPVPTLVVRTERDGQVAISAEQMRFIDLDREEDGVRYVRQKFESAMPVHLAYWNSSLWC